MNEYKKTKTIECVEELAAKYTIDKEKIFILIEYYKPFMTVKQVPVDQPKQSTEIYNRLSDVFSNLKSATSTKKLN